MTTLALASTYFSVYSPDGEILMDDTEVYGYNADDDLSASWDSDNNFVISWDETHTWPPGRRQYRPRQQRFGRRARPDVGTLR